MPTMSKKYNTKYYQKNKEQLDSYSNEKIICPVCHKSTSRGHLRRHEKSKFHLSRDIKK